MSHAGKTNPSEERQRKRIEEEWDEAHFGTHCVNCVPGDCPIYVLVKDGKVVREEAAGVREQVEAGVPDMNPMICQKGLACVDGYCRRYCYSVNPQCADGLVCSGYIVGDSETIYVCDALE